MSEPAAAVKQLTEVPMLDPQNELTYVHPDDAKRALSQGYKAATDEDIENAKAEASYEGVGGGLKAFGAAAARGATVGLSDVGLRAAGVEGKTLRGLEKAHPVLSFLGEGAGFLAPFTGPVSRLLGGAKGLVPATKLVEAGAAVAKGAEPAVAKLATGIGKYSETAGKIVSKYGSTVAGSATEGALFGAGRILTEAAMGDPELNAQKIAGHIGLSTLVGGGVGALFKGLGAAVPPVVKLGQRAIGKTQEAAEKAFIKTSAFVSGKPAEAIENVLQNRERSLITHEEVVEGTKNFTSAIQEQHHAIEGAITEYVTKVRPEEIAQSLKEHPVEQAFATASQIEKASSDLINVMAEKPSVYEPVVLHKLETAYKDFQKDIVKAESSSDIFQSLLKYKQTIDKKVKYGAHASPSLVEAENLLKGLRTAVKSSLENEGTWGTLAANHAATNDAISDYLRLINTGNGKGEILKNFMSKRISKSGRPQYYFDPGKVRNFLLKIGQEKGIVREEVFNQWMESSQNVLNKLEGSFQNFSKKGLNKNAIESLLEKNGLSLEEVSKQAEYLKQMGMLEAGAHNAALFEGAAAYGASSHPVGSAITESWALMKAPGLAVKRFAKLESVLNDTSEKIQKAAKAVVLKTGDMPDVSGFLGNKIAEALSQKDDTYQAVIGDLQNLKSDPERMVNSLSDSVQSIYQIAPNTAAGLQQSMVNAMNILINAGQVFQNPNPYGQKAPLSTTTKLKLAKTFHTLENPLSVFSDIKNKTLTRDTINILQAAYPKLLQEMQTEVLREITDLISKDPTNPKLTYQEKAIFSLFLGQPLDPSLTPESMLMSQGTAQNFGKEQMRSQMDQTHKMNTRGAGKTNFQNRILTDFQAASRRN